VISKQDEMETSATKKFYRQDLEKKYWELSMRVLIWEVMHHTPKGVGIALQIEVFP